MLDFGFYNMDCMDGMKEFPDKFFDLAIVDPPYGDAGGAGQTRNDSDNASTDTARIPRGGWHGKQKYYLGTPTRERGKVESPEQGANGRRSMEKNHRVGRRPGSVVF